MADSKSESPTPEMNGDKDLRQKKIETAVKFLQNPKVRQTPMAQRKAFLARKGLSKKEVELAIQQSGTAADEFAQVSTPAPPHSQIERRVPLPVTPMPVTRTWRGYLGAALVGGGLVYIVTHLIKSCLTALKFCLVLIFFGVLTTNVSERKFPLQLTYLLPFLINEREKQDEKLERIEASVAELKGNVAETVGSVQTTLNSVQRLLQDQQKKMYTLSTDLASTQSKLALIPSESFATGELKNEILSLKGLLLNRKQFPSPVIQSTPGAPSIPAWQRTQATSDSRPGGAESNVVNKEPPGSNKQSTPPVDCSAVDYSTTNGESHEQPNVATQLNKSVSAPELPNRTIEDVAAVEVIGQGKESPRSTGSETDTDSTGRTVITPGRRNLDDAMLEDKDSSVVSTDTSFSSLSDESGGTSFHESSIKFSSTCVKIPSASTLTSRPENSINELMNETD